MPGDKAPLRLIKFGPFEANLQSQELRKQGVRLHLPRQSFRMLKMFLERPGELITREELRQALWPTDTFVDFEHGLNAAINRLRGTLGDDADHPRYIETFPRCGYRFFFPVTSPDNDAPVSTRGGAKKRTYLAVTLMAAALILAGLGSRTYRWLSPVSASSVDSLAVLPFINVGGDANIDYLSDGITESLTDNLTHVPQLKVKSRHSVFSYKGKDLNVQKVGSELGVSALLTGRVTRHGEIVEVNAELTDVRDNNEIWGQNYSGKMTDIMFLERQIAGDIAGKLRSKLSTSEKQQVTRQGTRNPEAYELYVKGRFSWNKRTPSDLATAISYFEQAIARDPDYALAYSGLAEAYGVLTDFGDASREIRPKANAAARKALELDATLARPHAVLGTNEIEYEWDFAGGEAEFKKALELDPNDASAHEWYADDIGRIGGREQEAFDEADRAHQLDPLSPAISTVVGSVRNMARQFDEAILVCKKLENENPTFALAHACLLRSYWGKRMYSQVIEEWEAYGHLSGDRNASEFASALKQGFLSTGWKGALTRGIAAKQAQRKTGYSSAYGIAELYADLGDKDQAFRWLNTAYQERNAALVGLKTDFVLDPIRSDPRFAGLVHKVGLPQ